MHIPSWFWTLPWDDPKGFWLNMWAGIPFLFFDLVIITLLLPGAIEWWSRYRWAGSRREAIRYLFRDYREKNQILINLIGDLRNSPEMSRYELQRWEVRARERFAAAKFDMENCLQTALVVLDQDQTREILSWHAHWKSMWDYTIFLLDRFDILHISPERKAVRREKIQIELKPQLCDRYAETFMIHMANIIGHELYLHYRYYDGYPSLPLITGYMTYREVAILEGALARLIERELSVKIPSRLLIEFTDDYPHRVRRHFDNIEAEFRRREKADRRWHNWWIKPVEFRGEQYHEPANLELREQFIAEVGQDAKDLFYDPNAPTIHPRATPTAS